MFVFWAQSNSFLVPFYECNPNFRFINTISVPSLNDKPQIVKFRLWFKDKLAYLVYCWNFATRARQREERSPRNLQTLNETGSYKNITEGERWTVYWKTELFDIYTFYTYDLKIYICCFILLFWSTSTIPDIRIHNLTPLSPGSAAYIWLSGPSLLQIHHPPEFGTDRANCWVMSYWSQGDTGSIIQICYTTFAMLQIWRRKYHMQNEMCGSVGDNNHRVHDAPDQ